MPWLPPSEISCSALERKNCQLLNALKREITNLEMEQKFRLWELEHDRKQMHMNHLKGKKMRSKQKEMRKRRELNIASASMDSYTKTWMKKEFNITENDIAVEDVEDKDIISEKETLKDGESAKRRAPSGKSKGTIKDKDTTKEEQSASRRRMSCKSRAMIIGKDVATKDIVKAIDQKNVKPWQNKQGGDRRRSSTILPQIQITDGSVSGGKSPDTFVTRFKEEFKQEETIVEDTIEPLFIPQASRRLSTYIPPRLRSTSLPVISDTEVFDPDFQYTKKNRSKSLDVRPLLLPMRRDSGTFSRRDSNTDVMATERRISLGTTASKVIGDLSRGIRYRDFDERRESMITDEQWEELKKCRYLRERTPAPDH